MPDADTYNGEDIYSGDSGDRRHLRKEQEVGEPLTQGGIDARWRSRKCVMLFRLPLCKPPVSMSSFHKLLEEPEAVCKRAQIRLYKE